MTSALGSRWVCTGCGKTLDANEALPFRCPRAPVDGTHADDIDHVLRCELELERTPFPDIGPENPFLRFRALAHSWRLARRMGMTDATYVHLVRELDRAVTKVTAEHMIARGAGRDGALSEAHGMVITPYEYEPELAVWVKDETGQVAGSHKSRHLMGVAIHLAVVDELAIANTARRRLATFSCGNAALAAAVVANAAHRPLVVFVPESADPMVIRHLSDLGADVVRCGRTSSSGSSGSGDSGELGESGELSELGDPAYHGYRRAVRGGCIPFTCQGSECALTIEGGRILGYELAFQQRESPRGPLDRLFLQVGGGALASSVIQGLEIARDLGVLRTMPRVHAVQSERMHPLQRAWQRFSQTDSSDAVAQATRHRSRYMWPWEQVGTSVASGILDDETYDWVEIVRAMRATGGSVVLADEQTLTRARDLARATTSMHAVSATGAAGLAGVLALREAAGAGRASFEPTEEVGVIFTGVR